MTTALWAGLLAVAALWPSRLAGVLDGAPLDSVVEVVFVGVALPVAVWLAPNILRQSRVRFLIIALLAWKTLLAFTAVQDGWCVQFTSPVPIFVDDLRVPHAWDVRADWRSNPPRCSAIMTRGYGSLNEFPAWFYNLPPADFVNPAKETEQPPFVTPAIAVDGYLTSSSGGTFSLDRAAGVNVETRVDGHVVDAAGAPIAAGSHHVTITGVLSGGEWTLVPRWNGSDLFRSTVATTAAPSGMDRWLRPVGRYIEALLLLLVLVLAIHAIALRVQQPVVIAWTIGAAALFAAIGALAPAVVIRATPLVLAGVLAVPLRPRLRNQWGAALTIGVPFMALLTGMHARDAGIFNWYSIGDDFWMYQRFAYRIFLQGYWLEGGQPTFWFQPLYRWIAGALHMIFGDSSVGEVLWDGACAVAAGLFAFAVTRAVAGFRWAVAAMIVVLAVLTVGPMWYLFGRGLAEITSMGFIAAAALFAMRGRADWRYATLAGACAIVAFYARLNNLPIAVAVIAFAWPLRYPARDLWRARTMWTAASKRVLIGIAAVIAIGLVLFAARTWYYTGVFSLLHGTQGSARSVWQTTDEGLTPLQNVTGSFLVVLTMADPPRFEPRGLPIVLGLIAAILAVLRIRPFDRLPMNAVLLCLAGFAGALVARGSAYPGRFSAHILPVCTALCVSAAALIARRRSTSRA